MADSIFADRIVNIQIHGGVVRLDLGVIEQLPQGEKKAAKVTVGQRLVMPVDGFLAAFGMQEAIINKLKEDGMIKQKEASDKGKK